MKKQFISKKERKKRLEFTIWSAIFNNANQADLLEQFWVMCGQQNSEDKLIIYNQILLALLAHFANPENSKKLPTWVQPHVGEMLARIHDFFAFLEGSGPDSLSDQMLDYQSLRYEELDEESLAYMEERYGLRINIQTSDN